MTATNMLPVARNVNTVDHVPTAQYHSRYRAESCIHYTQNVTEEEGLEQSVLRVRTLQILLLTRVSFLERWRYEENKFQPEGS